MTDAAVDRYSREGSLVLGGAAAILLQLADPVVARGVAAHSAFALDPVRRLKHTLTFVYGAMLGSADERATVARFVNQGLLKLWLSPRLLRSEDRCWKDDDYANEVQ